MQIIISVIVNAVAVFAAGYILPGVHIQNFATAIIAAIVLGVLNTFLKPLLTLLTLPLTLITLGLFILVINAVIVLIASAVVPGFHVDNFWWAIAFSLVLSIVSSFLNTLTK